jgi:hypothetical protein
MSMRTLLAGLVVGVLLGPAVAHPERLDRQSAAALEETLRLLQGSVGTPAPGADPRLGDLAGSQALYDLASQVFRELAERYGGDPEKMTEALARAKNDPEGFAASLTPATRARLKALADTVPAAK